MTCMLTNHLPWHQDARAKTDTAVEAFQTFLNNDYSAFPNALLQRLSVCEYFSSRLLFIRHDVDLQMDKAATSEVFTDGILKCQQYLRTSITYTSNSEVAVMLVDSVFFQLMVQKAKDLAGPMYREIMNPERDDQLRRILVSNIAIRQVLPPLPSPPPPAHH